jgi:uncharacterized protein YbjT (DUF2867 family)
VVAFYKTAKHSFVPMYAACKDLPSENEKPRSGKKLRILVIAATGNLGQRITKMAVAAGHSVSVLVRSKEKLEKLFDSSRVGSLTAFEGDATDSAAVASACQGIDTIIESLGNEQRPQAIPVIVTCAANAGCSIVSIGGSPALQITPGELVPSEGFYLELQQLHIETLKVLQASGLKAWTTVNPGYMQPSDDGKPTGIFAPKATIIDEAAYKEGIKMTYEDVAEIMVKVADVASSGFNKVQIGMTFLK